jgi:methylated-DNA-[protein]-cysteine S-methyltransferase
MSGLERVFVTMESPVGTLTLTAAETALVGLSFETSRRPKRDNSAREEITHPVLTVAINQLREYFAGERNVFELPLQLEGTDFQKRVWEQLLLIPFGETCSYGDIAHRLGDPKLTRAVGLANGSNPIAIVVPCHRVIGASGALTGFGGGLRNKAILLDLERQEPAFDFLHNAL